MATTPAKEKILQRIREALSNPVPLPFPHSEGTQPVYIAAEEEHAANFAQEFTKLQGKFAFCAGRAELAKQLQSLFAERRWQKIFCAEPQLVDRLDEAGIATDGDLAACDASVTGCEYLVARTGSIVLSAAQQQGRTASVYAPVHVCIAYTDAVLPDIEDALHALREKYGTSFPSFITFASGPSRTADIEKTLVTGVHGPKEVYCFLTPREK